ncbi:Hypothetical protein D9617_44g038950 [Elsinoe fawcettii]|nr:Hypothetical protein D9617_44g038950 [Elsinoe fawcettii]
MDDSNIIESDYLTQGLYPFTDDDISQLFGLEQTQADPVLAWNVDIAYENHDSTQAQASTAVAIVDTGCEPSPVDSARSPNEETNGKRAEECLDVEAMTAQPFATELVNHKEQQHDDLEEEIRIAQRPTVAYTQKRRRASDVDGTSRRLSKSPRLMGNVALTDDQTTAEVSTTSLPTNLPSDEPDAQSHGSESSCPNASTKTNELLSHCFSTMSAASFPDLLARIPFGNTRIHCADTFQKLVNQLRREDRTKSNDNIDHIMVLCQKTGSPQQDVADLRCVIKIDAKLKTIIWQTTGSNGASKSMRQEIKKKGDEANYRAQKHTTDLIDVLLWWLFDISLPDKADPHRYRFLEDCANNRFEGSRSLQDILLATSSANLPRDPPEVQSTRLTTFLSRKKAAEVLIKAMRSVIGQPKDQIEHDKETVRSILELANGLNGDVHHGAKLDIETQCARVIARATELAALECFVNAVQKDIDGVMRALEYDCCILSKEHIAAVRPNEGASILPDS